MQHWRPGEDHGDQAVEQNKTLEIGRNFREGKIRLALSQVEWHKIVLNARGLAESFKVK